MFGHSSLLLPLLAVLQTTVVSATPTPLIGRQTGVTPLSSSQVEQLAPYAQFARAAYCPSTVNWQCGGACEALPSFQPTLAGGDGNEVQQYFVGYWPDQNTVVIAHEGTDPTQLLSDLTDAEIAMGTLDPTLFPGVSSSVLVHEGFRDEHALTAASILTEVQRVISEQGATSVTPVGHSLGGALAQLDSLFLTLNLPSSISINAVTFGTPRVGNPAYASLFDSLVPGFRRVNNEKDLIPIVPGRFLGFQHPHGETHLISSGNVVSCPGDDDAVDSECQILTVPNVLEGDILNHLGPYMDDISIGTIFC